MRLITKLFVTGGLIYLGARIGRHFLQGARGARRDVVDDDNTDDNIVDAEVVGLSAVEPGPLMGMGEAADRDALAAAHRSVPDQLERLPKRGKNLP